MSEASPSVSPSVSLPTIDLARDAAQQLPAVDRSLRDAGFLLVTGHGVDPDRPSPDVIRPVLRGDAAVADYLGHHCGRSRRHPDPSGSPPPCR